MFVITRNGKTTVYTGWQAWLMGALALVAVWLIFAFIAFFVVGLAVTVGFVTLLAVPAIIAVAVISSAMRR